MTNNVIFCFTGTGNSLFIAKEMAKATGDKVKIIRKALFNEELCEKYSRIGLIFPVYHQGLPVMVMEFIKKFRDVNVNYVYAISTYGDKPTLTLRYLKSMLKQQNVILNIGFAIQMPYNYLRPKKFGKGMYDSFSIKIPSEKDCNIQYRKAEEKLNIIKKAVEQEVSGDIEISDGLIESLVDILNLRDTVQKRQWLKVAGYKDIVPKTFIKAIGLMDTKFTVTDQCISCRLCECICPADNITFLDGKPKWNHHCEQCMACLHWCTVGAINYGVKLESPMQYKHPKITIKDIINEGD